MREGMPIPQRTKTTQEKVPFDIEKCLAKAQGVIEAQRLPLASFADLYGAEVIEKDKSALIQRTSLHEKTNTDREKNAKKIATCFEAFVMDQINNGMFGVHANSLPTSEFDDVINGVDSVTEIAHPAKPTQHLGLAIDSTYSAFNLGKKFEGITTRLNAGRIATVKYFQSERSGIRGEYTVPLFVTGMSQENMLPLLSLWTDNNVEKLSSSPHALVLLKQIEAQAVKFEELCRAKKHITLADRYRTIQSTISDIKQEKRREIGTPILPAEWKNDQVSNEILRQTETIRV